MGNALKGILVQLWTYLEKAAPVLESVIIPGVVAVLVSLLGLYVQVRKDKRDTITHALTQNRMEWIEEVRSLIGEFIDAYIDRKPDNELRKIKSKIALYCRNNVGSDYQQMLNCIETCCKDTAYKEDNLNELVEESQKVLNLVWLRIKVEGGVDGRADRKIVKKVKNYYKDERKAKSTDTAGNTDTEGNAKE